MRKIKIPVFKTVAYLYVGMDEYPKYAKMFDDCSEIEDTHHGACGGNGIWVRDPNNKGALAHEVAHVVDFIMIEIIGMGANQFFHQLETRAYLTEFIFNKFSDYLDGLPVDKKQNKRDK